MTECDTSSRSSNSRPAIGAIGRWIIAIALFATVAITGVFLAILVMHARRQARTNQCRGNLVAIVLGMHYHDDKYGHLPPAYVANPEGKRLHSWRILLVEHYGLPFPVQYDFNEAWDHGDNQRVADYRPVMYACPSDPVTQKNNRLTNYFVIMGSNTPFPGSRTAPLPRSADGRGSSNTILIVESTNRNIEWLEPRDLPYHAMSLTPNAPSRPSLSSHHPGGPMVMMADGSVRSVKGIDPDVLRAMIEYVPDPSNEHELQPSRRAVPRSPPANSK